MRYGALILCLTLLLVQFRQSIVHLDYVVNKDYIAKVLCIEKDVEESTCAGQCHLKKELAKVETGTDDPVETPQRLIVEEIHFFSLLEGLGLKASNIEQELNLSIELIDPVRRGFHSIFIPPPEMT